MAGKFKVIFDGFETLEQAQAFVNWYTHIGEQESSIYMEENSNLTFVGANKSHADEETREIIVPLNLYKK
jgi:hypothetical protein